MRWIPWFFAVGMMNTHVEICKAFSRQAAVYEKNAVAQTEIGKRLFERLDYLKISPRYVLDLGCGTGYFTAALKKRYPKAVIIGLDLTLAMLRMSEQKQGWFNKWPLVAADMQQLPFEAGVFDLIFANQVLHWADSLPQVFRELNRIMHKDACLMFTTLGPDTFRELRQAFRAADTFTHTNTFMDMHDIGDMLMEQRFEQPVMDMEMLTLHYPSLQSLVKSLKAQGVRNINTGRNPGLTGKQAWKNFEQAWQDIKTSDGKFPLSYEIIYGHAWKGHQMIGSKGIETVIPVSSLKRNNPG